MTVNSNRVKRAETAGFCMGVALALKKLDRALDKQSSLTTYTFGPIIHNPQVLAHYARKGVQQAEDIQGIKSPAQVVIRAHGIPVGMKKELLERHKVLVDATCPRVKKAQTLIAEQVESGRRLLLFGEKDHPEVIGLLSYGGHGALVFESLERLQEFTLDPEKKYFLAAQTTQDRKEFSDITVHLKKTLDRDIPILDTICDATRERQQEALAIASQVDYMVVVGGFSSGNTRRLVQIARDTGTPCVHVETEAELPAEDISRAAQVGLTAGASTPKIIIDRVEKRLLEILGESA